MLPCPQYSRIQSSVATRQYVPKINAGMIAPMPRRATDERSDRLMLRPERPMVFASFQATTVQTASTPSPARLVHPSTNWQTYPSPALVEKKVPGSGEEDT